MDLENLFGSAIGPMDQVRPFYHSILGHLLSPLQPKLQENLHSTPHPKWASFVGDRTGKYPHFFPLPSHMSNRCRHHPSPTLPFPTIGNGRATEQTHTQPTLPSTDPSSAIGRRLPIISRPHVIFLLCKVFHILPAWIPMTRRC
jgi:hypothetical protein